MNWYPAIDFVTRPFIMRAYKTEIVGREHVPEVGACILASNHESILDPWFLGLATRRAVHYMAKAELFRYPVLKQVLRALGCFPVHRGTADRGAVDHGLELLRNGDVLGIFPQGTCLPYRDRPFRRGAARLALVAGAPIVPVALIGTERTIQPRSHRIGFPHVKVLVGEPIEVPVQEPTRERAAELTARLEAAVTALRGPYPEPDHIWFEAA